MKSRDWRDKIDRLTVKVIKGRGYPLLLKDLAWKIAGFAAKCGESNPVSFAIRPLVMHSRWRQTVGIYLGLVAVTASVIGPEHLAARQYEQSGVIVELPEPQVSTSTTERVVFPIPTEEVSQGFWLLHKGVDLRTSEGTPINPVMGGTVEQTEYGKYGYGNKIIVDHGNGYKSLYAHLSSIEVVEGEKVSTDKVIGKTGNTGRSTGPHLHLEIWEDGTATNPSKILGK